MWHPQCRVGRLLHNQVQAPLTVLIRRSVARDAADLAPRLRPDDAREVLAAGSPSSLHALSGGYIHSTHCLTVTDEDDVPQIMFGVCGVKGEDLGYIWLLGSDFLDKHPVHFLRLTPKWLDAFHADFPLLGNYVDARNTLHIKCLKWFGFSFLRRALGSGPGNPPFLEFARLKHV